MITLAQLQDTVARDLLGSPGLIEPLIHDGPRAEKTVLADAYRYAYGARLVEVLGNDFPATAALLGPEGFDAAARGYIARHPSRHYSIRWAGRDLAADLAAQGLATAADLAAFEWALGLAFDAAEPGVAAVETLASLAPEQWEGLRLLPHPSLQRLDLGHAAHLAWAGFDATGAVEAPAALEAPLPLAVWRAGLDVQYRPLQPDEARLLDAMAAGAPLGAALGETDPALAVNFLAGWCAGGLVAELLVD